MVFYVTQDTVANRGDALRFRAVDYCGGGSKAWRYMLCMSPTGSIGIGQDYGTEVLEVCGNIKANSLILTKSLYTTTITPSSAVTTSRTITLPDADLTLTAYSGPDQSVSTTASPSFAGMSVTTASSLPSYAQGTLFITGSSSSSTPQRMFIGDGYGWSLCLSTRSNSNTADLYTFADSGVLTLSSPQGLKIGNNFPTQAHWSNLCAMNQVC